MLEEQKTMQIEPAALIAECQKMKDGGYRLVQIGATTVKDGYELNYSFDKEYRFINLRVVLAPAGASMPSISPVYWNAFLYENEIQDLFGIKIQGMAVDYKGNFYKTTVKFPFGAARQEKKADTNG